MIKLLSTIFFIILFNNIDIKNFIIENKNNENKLINYNYSLSKLTKELKINKHNIKIVVSKTKYRLYIMSNNTILKSYPVVFGFNPIDDKLIEGDGCTPEGEFKIKAKYPHKPWSKFIWIDYPNKISFQKHNKAKKDGIISKESKIGGEVGIHGVPQGYDNIIDDKNNWTLGCVSLKTKDINEIYDFINLDTKVLIKK